MSVRPLTGIRAAVFDAYGTLFDYNSAAARCREALGDKSEPLARLWRDKQIQYTWLRTLMGRHADFWQVTGDGLDYALETLGIADAALRERLMSCFLTLDCFPEVPAMLASLRRAGMKTAILSNGTPRMLEAAVASAKLAPLLDASLSVETAGVFKPHPKVYQLAVDALGVPASAIAFQSSNAWDAHGAAAFGFQVVWCNRYGAMGERLPGALAAEIRTLAALPALLGVGA